MKRLTAAVLCGAFVKTHRRVELISYFNSKPGSIFDLANKPKSRAAYRQAITPLR